MTISEILAIFKNHGLLRESQALEGLNLITGRVCVDNRLLREGDIFVCVRGQNADGHSFIGDARQKGAALLVCENSFTDSLPAIRVTESRKAAALLAKIYYHNPSSRFRLVGVTGTNGKTTTSTILFKATRELGYRCGMIGTLGYDINDRHYDTRHTTPDILELNQIFANMADEDLQYVFMEVSSHALSLDRVYGVEFDLCLFTNLTREHLDFHHTMEEYGNAKKLLFQSSIEHRSVAVINVEDSFGADLFQELADKGAYAFSVGSQNASFLIRPNAALKDAELLQSRFSLVCGDGIVNVRSPLAGRFNVFNLALSAAAMSVLGFEKRQIEQGLNSVKPVRGRFEGVTNPLGIGVYVDYAHTPDAMENVLRAAREIARGRVICLFGAGGERDQGKRPLMLKTALQYSEAVIVTDDNPRRENPDTIIRDIVRDSSNWLPWWIIRDRREAIFAALSLARPGDVVMLCGKGHETYQEIGTERFPFNDAAVAEEYFDTLSTEQSDPDYLALPVDRITVEILADVLPRTDTGYTLPRVYRRISTDSRTLRPGSLFFALKGDRFDAHDYLDSVLIDESVLAIGEKPMKGFDNYLQAKAAVAVMAGLHRKYLMMFPAYRIALTGSTGKSSTKEMLAKVFGAQAPTLKTFANENNIIGLCKTISRIRPEHRYAIFELGTNAFGEIAQLSDICAPNAGIILNIGPSHLEFLENEEGVFREKSALFNRPLDHMLFDADDPRFAPYLALGKGVGVGGQADFRIHDIVCNTTTCKFFLNDSEYRIPYTIPHYIRNAGFAIAMGLSVGIAQSDIQKALSEPIALDMRMQIVEAGGRLLVIDCYNANPVSMRSAIEHWMNLAPGRAHLAFLADMLELGSAAPAYHDMIATILAEKGAGDLITVGDLSARYHGGDKDLSGRHFADVDTLIGSGILHTLAKDAVVLVKGSHSMHLDKLIPILTKEK